MTETGIKMLDGFYETGAGAFAFMIGGDCGSAILWINSDEPDTMYIVWGLFGIGLSSLGCFFCYVDTVAFRRMRDIEPINVLCTFERKAGEWIRNIELF